MIRGIREMCFLFVNLKWVTEWSKFNQKLANQIININPNLTGNTASIIRFSSSLCRNNWLRFYALCTQHILRAI